MTKLNKDEIVEVEQQVGHLLPSLYVKLLSEIGYGRSNDREIYHPASIAALYQHHFEQEEDLFLRYFPFGCHNRLQELWLIDVSIDKVARIWHETHPDDYPEERWRSFDEWTSTYLPWESPMLDEIE